MIKGQLEWIDNGLRQFCWHKFKEQYKKKKKRKNFTLIKQSLKKPFEEKKTIPTITFKWIRSVSDKRERNKKKRKKESWKSFQSSNCKWKDEEKNSTGQHVILFSFFFRRFIFESHATSWHIKYWSSTSTPEG